MSAHDATADVDPLTAPPGDTFVIHQHHATAYHHDLRLEMMNGDTPVLVSWAVPKELPRRRGERHLAIHVEDHSIEYGSYTGTIDEGEYGAGVVRIFDRGTFEVVDRNEERITFRLHGERLAGRWHLVHTGVEKGKDQWLVIMSEDLRPEGDAPPDAEPMLATTATDTFDDPDWFFEPKWNGLRTIAICGDDTELTSPDARDTTAAFPELSLLHRHVVALDAMLDGEVVAFADGVPSVHQLQQRVDLSDPDQIEQAAKRTPVVFVAYDLLFLDGTDLTAQPLAERRALLEELFIPTEKFLISPVTREAGVALLEAVAGQGMNGIVAKRKMSAYEPGTRTEDWLEITAKVDGEP